MRVDYPAEFEELKIGMGELALAAPGPMKAFAGLHESAVDDGRLSPKVKELIALAIGVSVRCDGCIAYHAHEAVGAGAGLEEIAEAIGVAVLMGGGPSVVYGSQALDAAKQFLAAKEE